MLNLFSRLWIFALVLILPACIPFESGITPGAVAASPIPKSTQLQDTLAPTLTPTLTAEPTPSRTPLPPTTSPEPTQTISSPTAPIPDDWLTYQNPQADFSLAYPPDGTLVEDLPEHARIDLPFLPGTNLQEKYLEVDVATLEADQTCSSPFAAGYDPRAVERETVNVLGETFTREGGAEGAAGGTYDWVAYSIARLPVCISMTFILHSANAANYEVPPGEYDPVAEEVIFEQILSTFEWRE